MFEIMNRCALPSRLFAVLASVLVLGGSSPLANAQTKHSMTLEDSESLKQAYYLQLSPNGEMLVYVLDGEMWLIRTQHGSVSRKLGKGTVPIWSPDGQRLAYYVGDTGTLQLWVLDLETDRSEQVTHLEGGINPDLQARISGWSHDPLLYSWSPDGTKLVFASQVTVENASSEEARSLSSHPANEAEAPLVLTTETPAKWTLSGVFSHDVGRQRWVNGKLMTDSDPQAKLSPAMVNQLFIADTNSKKTAQLTKDEAVYFNPDWSPDGREIVCASTEGRSLTGYGTGTTNIYIIDIATGQKTALTTGGGNKRLPYWSPDGKWVAYLGREEFDMQSVFVVQKAGGKPLNVTSSMDRYIWDFYWSADSKSIFAGFANGVSTSIADISVPIGAITKPTQKEAALRWPTTVSRSGTLAWQQSDPSSMSVIYVLPPAVSSPQMLWDLNPQVKNWKLGEQEVVQWKNYRGDELEGILIKPIGYQEGHKYPLIVDCYPGSQNMFYGFPMTSNQELASRGYAIFYPNARSPISWMNPFKTRASAQAAKGPKGWDVTADDVMSGVDELIRRGVVDPDRMGLFGFSMGGGIVNYLVTKTNRFKCAVSVGPVLLDWSRAVFLSIFSPMIQTIAGVSPWEDPEAYVQLSPIYRAKNVTTPLLLANGDDDVEGLLNTIEMYNSLRWFGRDVTFLRYPNQGHSLTGSARKDFWTRMNVFLDRYLSPKQMTK